MYDVKESILLKFHTQNNNFVLFTMTVFHYTCSPGQTMSAICSYSLSEIEKVFSGKVKYKESGIWRQIKNPGHIKEVSIFLMLRTSFKSIKSTAIRNH